ncbi:hypothetical protein SAV31267_046810 [Streptomyces avermitilis]|uniref:Uncharacterized protein n=1 Tax=Streptomyces avermitilis TaxID=33903 RepID=A0A4D4MU25_STRAX|nr:hypothetical protein SAV31267_046810 [Streptomyces avermitilis]
MWSRSSSRPSRASPAVAPQMAATGTPASRKARAVRAKGARSSPESHRSAPVRISRELSSGRRPSSARSGWMRMPPRVVTGSRVGPTVRIAYPARARWAVVCPVSQSAKVS